LIANLCESASESLTSMQIRMRFLPARKLP
jgi:hypothetical protein